MELSAVQAIQYLVINVAATYTVNKHMCTNNTHIPIIAVLLLLLN